MQIRDGAKFDKDHFLVPHHYAESVDSILIPHGLVIDRVQKLAADIRMDYDKGGK
jgi:hypoxanthine phosphoribosyltransferase